MSENIQEKEVESIVINYGDGTQKLLGKGMIINLTEEDSEISLSMTMCHMSGPDVILYMKSILMSCMEFVEREEE